MRVNLSLDDGLLDLLKKEADQHNCTVNVYLTTLLEQIYKQKPFDYPAALKVLESEAMEMPVGVDFTLADLPSFREICVVQAQNRQLRPSTVRARLGKLFCTQVRENAVGDVRRSTQANGQLKFIARAAVYCRMPVEEEA